MTKKQEILSILQKYRGYLHLLDDKTKLKLLKKMAEVLEEEAEK